METLQSERLTLRMVNSDDAPFILELYNSQDFLRFVGDKQLGNQEDAKRYIDENILAMHRQHGVCLLLVEKRDSLEKLGVCGLIKRPELSAYDIGYGFKPAAYGQGFGLEAGLTVLDYAKRQSHIDQLVAITTSDNDSSRALLSKLGFSYIKVQQSLSDTIDLLLYQREVD